MKPDDPNDVIPTADQQRETDRQDAQARYRERVINRVNDAGGNLAMTANALRSIYNDPDNADRASALARQVEEFLADLEES